MSTTTGRFAGYTITELEKLALWELGQVIGTTVSYSRFPRWLLRSKFNDRQNVMVTHSKCLRKLALIPAVEGRRTYRLPENCMDGGLISAKYYTAADDYLDLMQQTAKWMDEHRIGWRVEETGDPEIIIDAPSYGNNQTISVHPVPGTDGVSYADALDTGVYLGTVMPGTGTNISGTCSSLGSAILLNDNTRTFTADGLVAGMAVLNLTDGSVGRLSTIAANALTLSSALTGGTDNTFQAGDSYVILAGEYAVVTDVKKPDRYVFASEIGMLDNLTIPANTILIEFCPFPAAFPFNMDETDANQGSLNMYPEIPKIYHHGLAMGVVADILGTFNESTKEFARAAEYERKFIASAQQARGERSRPFGDAGARFVPSLKKR